MFLIARRVLGQFPAIVAAAFFAFDPIIVYVGRRAVHESLGLTFCLIGLLILTRYLDDRQRKWLVLVGVAFGLALAVKLIFLPFVAGVVISVALLDAGLNWRAMSQYGKTIQLWRYLSFAALIFASILMLNILGGDVPLPIFDPLVGLPPRLQEIAPTHGLRLRT